MRIIILVTCFISFSLNNIMGQESTIPYHKIESYPASYTMGGVVSRMLDGLGYRYHWASKDLRADDLSFEPGNEGKNTMETLKHIYELSADALALSLGQEFKRPRVKVEELDYNALREKTLYNFNEASQNFRKMNDAELANLKVVFAFADSKRSFEFWHFLNGQLSDAIYHTGQIVSYRRSSGNPVSKDMNVFTGGM